MALRASIGSLKRGLALLLTGLAALAACTGEEDAGTSASTTTTVASGPNSVECTELAIEAAQPLQDFIDEYQDLTPEEWNALDPPPDVQPIQDAIIEELQAAANDGCEPSVLEAAVVGSRNDEGLETTVAFVVPATGHTVDPAELEQHCRDRMAAFKRPREIHVVDELPKTATGKIRRFALRDQLG